MSVDEAFKILDGLRGAEKRPYTHTEKKQVAELYPLIVGKDFRPTSCQQCYHDATIEMYLTLRKTMELKDKCEYRLRAGAIILCPDFHEGKVYTNDNLTNEVAAEYLEKYPNSARLFQRLPEKPVLSVSNGEKKTKEATTKEAPKKAVKRKKNKK